MFQQTPISKNINPTDLFSLHYESLQHVYHKELKHHSSLSVQRETTIQINGVWSLHNERFIFEPSCGLLTTICVTFDFAIWRLCRRFVKAQLQVDILTSIFSLKVLQVKLRWLSESHCVSLSFFVTVYLCGYKSVYSLHGVGNMPSSMGSIFTPVILVMVLSHCRLMLATSQPDRISTAYM